MYSIGAELHIEAVRTYCHALNKTPYNPTLLCWIERLPGRVEFLEGVDYVPLGERGVGCFIGFQALYREVGLRYHFGRTKDRA